MNIFLKEFGISPDQIAARRLRAYPEAVTLVVAEIGPDGREHLLLPAAAEAWRALKSAADNDGVSLFIVSAFRSITRQAEIIRRKLAAGASIEQIVRTSAPPGFSEHHTGCAVDLSTEGEIPLEVSFEATPAFRWLGKRAGEFGFTLSYPVGNRYGYDYEPWHWRFDSAPRAASGAGSRQRL